MRRYHRVTRYLNALLAEDSKATPKMKLAAAMRLSEILLEADRREAVKETAIARAEARRAEAELVRMKLELNQRSNNFSGESPDTELDATRNWMHELLNEGTPETALEEGQDDD